MSEHAFSAIGVLYSDFTEPIGTPIQGRFAPEALGSAVVREEFTEGLDDIEGFSHLYLIYVFDRSHDYRLKVTPYRDTTERGVFATRAPKRPNQIGLSIVRLIAREENVLRLAEVDFLNESPLLDIKPYVPTFDQRENARFGWLEDSRERTVADDRFHDGA